MVSRGWTKASACCFHICVSCATLYCVVRRPIALPVFLDLDCFPFQAEIHNVHRLSRILLTCPGHVHFRLLTCSIPPMTCSFLLPKCLFSLSWHMVFTKRLSILILFVQLLSRSLSGLIVPLLTAYINIKFMCYV